MIAGPDAPVSGEAKNSWLTGTAAWTFVAISQGILGIRPEYSGLRVDPCIPKAWKGFGVQRQFRGTQYDIEVRNPQGLCRGVQQMTIDGKVVAGNVIPLQPAGKGVSVVITLG
jgi:cellobiose phosphorylase